MTDSNFQILLFYKYIDIPDPEGLKYIQTALCKSLNLTGRLIISKEGVNGTFEGLKENIEIYCQKLLENPLFQNVHLKKSEGIGQAFPKLSIKIRDEIVSTHLKEKDVNPNKITGKHIKAQELHEWITSGKEFYIIDMRNDYEHSVGYFENSILPPIEHFRDLPKILPEIESLKNKTVVTVCTGGVRCEKASGFLIENGFADVYQLFGGIVTYMEAYPNEHFKGKLYVFDQRVTMGFNTTSLEHEIIGKCKKCGDLCEEFVNCGYDDCHKHFICCKSCRNIDEKAFCSKGCEDWSKGVFSFRYKLLKFA